MASEETSLIFANGAAGGLINTSFIITIIMCLIFTVRAFKKDDEGNSFFLGMTGFGIFLTPLAVAMIAMGNNVGTGVNLLNVLDNIQVLWLFSASKLVMIDVVLVLWLMFVGFATRKAHD